MGTDPFSDPERYLLHGRLERMPRRHADRLLVLRYIASRVLGIHEPVTEKDLTSRLAELARDPIGLRRDLVDAGLVTRTRDGAEYRRTLVTEFDPEGPGRQDV
jgi:hypothetical protein